MKHILHLVSGEGDHARLADQVIELQKQSGDLQITVVRLGSDPGAVDYPALLQAIFAADAVHAW